MALACSPGPEGNYRGSEQASGRPLLLSPDGIVPEGIEDIQLPVEGWAEPVSASLWELEEWVADGTPSPPVEQQPTRDLIVDLEADRSADGGSESGTAMSRQPDPHLSFIDDFAGGNLGLSEGVAFAAIDRATAPAKLFPPDPDLAAGPGHLIVVVNNSVEIYDQLGNSPLGPLALATFFSPLATLAPGCVIKPFDPNALYDEDQDRFIVTADGLGDYLCIAVSQGPDPLFGGWNFYGFATAFGSLYFDFPRLGVGHEAIFGGATWAANGLTSGWAWAFEKSAMYAGTIAAYRAQPIALDAVPQALHLHGAAQGTWPTSGPHYIIASLGGGGPSSFGLYSWLDPFGNNTFSQVATLDLQTKHGVTSGVPTSSPQASGRYLLGNDARPLDFEYRNGSGWLLNHVSCRPGHQAVNCIQWAEIDLASGTVVQAAVAGTDGEYRIYPDLAVNRCGDALLGYTKTSTALYPGPWISGRRLADPLGKLRHEQPVWPGETELEGSTLDPGPLRWGDYSGMTLAPDGITLWYLGQYAKNISGSFNWGTYLASFRFAGC